jgi:hypothetical protein
MNGLEINLPAEGPGPHRGAHRAPQRHPAVEPWVGVTEAARHLACRRQRICDLVCRRSSSGIPHGKEGGRLLFRLSKNDRSIQNGKV